MDLNLYLVLGLMDIAFLVPLKSEPERHCRCHLSILKVVLTDVDPTIRWNKFSFYFYDFSVYLPPPGILLHWIQCST